MCGSAPPSSASARAARPNDAARIGAGSGGPPYPKALKSVEYRTLAVRPPPQGKTEPMSVARILLAASLFSATAALLPGCAGSTATDKAAAPAAAQSSGNGSVIVDDRRLLRFFGLMDEDGNGTVSRPEFQSGKGSVFMAMDADGSMALTPNETRLKPEAFNLLAGGDGMVDSAEFLSADIAQFEKIDANGDHEITYPELRDYMAKYE